MRISDLRGAFQLAAQATTGVTRIVEGVHQSVWSTMGFPGNGTTGKTRGITGAIYRIVHGVTRVSSKGADSVMAGFESLFESTGNDTNSTPRRESLLSVLNGVMGDRLVQDNSPFAIPMTLRHKDRTLCPQFPPAATDTSRKIALLIHGLCMSDLKLHARYKNLPAEPGDALSAALGYCPVYVRYNSGLHISQNGRELSIRLEQMVDYWPVTIEELSVVAHSMGGLLIRSALHHAKLEGLSWPARVKNIVFLGTPHHGAPLERIGNWLDAILGAAPYTKPFAALGRLRSAGITDLRFGNVQQEDWHGRHRFQLEPDNREFTPLPADINCYSVAAALAENRSTLSDRLIGDGIVPLNSALGRHQEAQRTLAFPKSAQWIAHGTNHMELLHVPEVIHQLVQWLSPLNKTEQTKRNHE